MTCGKINSHHGGSYITFHNIESFPDIRYYIEKANAHYKGSLMAVDFFNWFTERHLRSMSKIES